MTDKEKASEHNEGQTATAKRCGEEGALWETVEGVCGLRVCLESGGPAAPDLRKKRDDIAMLPQCIRVFTLRLPTPYPACRPTSRERRTSLRRWPFLWTQTKRKPIWRATSTTLVHTHSSVRVCRELGMCARELHSVGLSTRPLPAYAALQGVWSCGYPYTKVCSSLAPDASLCVP